MRTWIGVLSVSVLSVLLFGSHVAWGQTVISIGGGAVANPVFINVYWEDSRAAWDADVGSSGATVERLDAMLKALNQSYYLAGLQDGGAFSGYGVSSWSVADSLVIGEVCPGLGGPPTNTSVANNIIATGGVGECLESVLGSRGIDLSSAVLVLHYAPQTAGGGDDGLCSPQTVAYHDTVDIYPNAMDVATNRDETHLNFAFIPCACLAKGIDAAFIFRMQTHEMVEAATNSEPNGPDLGYRSSALIKGAFEEIGDLCEPSIEPGSINFEPFLEPVFLGADATAKKDNGFGANKACTKTSNLACVAQYWIQPQGTCGSGFGANSSVFQKPVINQVSRPQTGSFYASGRGEHMAFYLNYKSAPGSIPWDLPSKKGKQTMYLSLSVASKTSAGTWGAGGFLKATPDTIGFGEIDAGFANDPPNLGGYVTGGTLSYQIYGFDQDVQMAPDDPITIAVSDPLTGKSTFVTVPAPAPDNFENTSDVALWVEPPTGSPVSGWTVFGDDTQVVAQVGDGNFPSGDATHPTLSMVKAANASHNYFPYEADPIKGYVDAFGDYSGQDSTDSWPSTWSFSTKTDAWGRDSFKLVSTTAGQAIVVFQGNGFTKGATRRIDIHPVLKGLIMPKSPFLPTLRGAGFAPAEQGPRTTVTLAGLPATDVNVSADGQTLTFTPPSFSASIPQDFDIVVSVDGVPSQPIKACHVGNTVHTWDECKTIVGEHLPTFTK
jgi:hypothetical protein